MAVSQTEAQQEVLVSQTLLLYDVHVCVVELQSVGVERQARRCVGDGVTSTADFTRRVTHTASGARRVGVKGRECEEEECRPQ